ncbi:MAG: hypothetical protein LIO93_09040 [Bacteroidales bacterium]|nr:hypothetical protein [Bacteroidales bacterium]
MQIKNDCGEFSSSCTLTDNQLKIQVKKIFYHNYEPKENWPKLLEIMDATNNFIGKTIFLEKL